MNGCKAGTKVLEPKNARSLVLVLLPMKADLGAYIAGSVSSLLLEIAIQQYLSTFAVV